MASVTGIILAAGQGTRMKSAPAQSVCTRWPGSRWCAYALATVSAVTGATPVLVVGHGAEQVRAALGEQARYVEQPEQLRQPVTP